MKNHIFNTILLCLTLWGVGHAQNYILFHAYPADWNPLGGSISPAGHAFVTFIHKDIKAQQTIMDGKFGFSPKEILKALVISDAKKMDTWDEWKAALGHSEKVDFVVEVDKDTYDKCLQLKEIWQYKNYSVIADQTCVSFIREIAAKIQDLTIPNGLINKLPKPYLNSLRKANEEIDIKSRNSLYSTMETYPSNSGIKKEYIKPLENPTIKTLSDWIGGASPEELGKILLKALKTNDSKTWAKTVLPIEKEVENDNNDYKAWADWHATKRFELIRDGLEGAGVTNWSLVEFSRVIYSTSKLSDGSKSAQNPVVEFTYKNKEFVGSFNFVIFYSNNGKFYVPGVQPRILSIGTLTRNKNN